MMSGCVLWLRADLGITTVSGNVSQWNNQSGSGLDVSQGTPGLRPAFVSSSINGRPAVDFDGSDDTLTNTVSNLATASSARTLFVVGISDVSAGGTLFCYKLSNRCFSNYLTIISGTSYAASNGLDGGSNVILASGQLGGITSNFQANWTCTGNGNAPGVRLNRSALTVNSGTQTGAEDGATGFEIGRSTSGQFWNGRIGELIGFNRALSAVETTEVETYQRAYYNLA
jgi:hypothetical protein